MATNISMHIATALLAVGSILLAGDHTSTVSPGQPARLQGSLAAGKKESWTVSIKGGKEARLLILKGRRGVVADIYDPQNITPNEGVAEEDWFPVAPGQYKVIVTNVTGLGTKSGGQNVAYEIKIEAK